MKPISDFQIYTDFQITIESELCGVAKTLIECNVFSNEVARRIDDIIFSYLNECRTVVESYQGLYGSFVQIKRDLNYIQRDKTVINYDVTFLNTERQIVILSRLFLISIKSQIDLMIVLADLLMNKKIEEFPPDFNKFLKKHQHSSSKSKNLVEHLIKYRDEESSQWLKRTFEIRNRIIHRGYNLRLTPKPGDTLSLNLYDGINRISTDFVGIQTVNIGLLFEQYLNEIKCLESIISLGILEQYGKKQRDITTGVSYSFSDVFNGYSFTPKPRGI